MNKKYTFTVFTAAYNRAQTLHRVYDSLKAQTYRDFEWVIADNGSSDNVKEVVQKWIDEADFTIRLISWEQNVWWHGAFNRGVQAAEGEFFFNFDSDDSCSPNLLEVLKKYWDLIPDASKPEFSAVTCLCADQHGNLVGDKFPQDILDSSLSEMRYRYKVKGEKKGFQKTDVLKQFPFPEFKGFYTAGIIWNEISRHYKTRFINEILVTWYIDEPDRKDQLTFHSKIGKDSQGSILNYQDILNREINWFRFAPKEFLRTAVHYSRFSLHCGISLRDQLKNLTPPLARFLWGSMLPVAYLVFLKDKKGSLAQ